MQFIPPTLRDEWDFLLKSFKKYIMNFLIGLSIGVVLGFGICYFGSLVLLDYFKRGDKDENA